MAGSLKRRLISYMLDRYSPDEFTVGDVPVWDGEDFVPSPGGVGGPESDPIAIHPGETLTEIVGDDGGVGYESPGNVPVHAYRIAGDLHDRILIQADGTILFGDGTAYPANRVGVSAGQMQITGGVGSAVVIQGSSTVNSILFTDEEMGFFGHAVAQPAPIADATDPASTQARLNDLLEALRGLGLIASI